MKLTSLHWIGLCAVLSSTCAGTTPPPQAPSAAAGPDAAKPTDPPAFAPVQATEPGPALAAMGPGQVRLKIRQDIFNAAWTAVRDKDFDKTLGGVDWEATRAKYQPLALAAPDEPTFYRLLNEMLGAIGQSHLEVHGPGDAVEEPEEVEQPKVEPAPARGAGNAEVIDIGTGIGDPGLVVRLIEGKPTVSWVRPLGSAALAGVKPGYLVTHIGGRSVTTLPPSPRPLRPVEERFRLRRHAMHLLSGPVGSKVSVRFLDGGDQPHEAMLTRDAPARSAVQALLLPPVVPEVRISQTGDVGIIAFNFFLLDPILGEVQKAIDRFRQNGAKALILDLRGNPGGFGGMAIPVAARLVSRETNLGTIQFRAFANNLVAAPSLGAKPFTGKVVILTDEGSASTSEILAAGLQEAKRVLVVGDNTVGAALGSTIEALPGGAVMQIPVAGFHTPKGVAIEGRGVQPDRRVLETRAALLSGHDPVLDEALQLARSAR
jgi:carboxyl-terminal processing protease